MMKYGNLFMGVSAVVLAAAGGASAAPATDASVSEVVVTADKAGLLERRASSTVFGLNKPLIETPRSATLISDATIQRYGIKTIDNLTAIAPGTFTASFYGIPGVLNIRGTNAENYYQGFKLINNLGTYTTPIADASRIDVVRGPPSPIYGPGKVGGWMNFVPKSARALNQPEGEVDATIGAYDQYNINAQGGAPIKWGAADGGFYAYAEYDHGDQFYYGIKPEHEMGQISANFDFPGDWSFEGDAMIYASSGDVQTPGWNRLTQALIDHGTYITGRNTSAAATPGAGYITPNQLSLAGSYPFGAPAISAPYFGFYGGPPVGGDFTLDTGFGTTHLSPRQVYVSPYDFSKTFAPTIYIGLKKGFADASSLKLEIFFNSLENKRFVSYGFPAWLRGNAVETRLSYQDRLSAFDGLLTVDNVIGVGDRYVWARDMQSYNSGFIALDRRDIAFGATPNDIPCDPFVAGITGDQFPASCLGWENDVHSEVNDLGAFFTSDISLYKRLDLTLGGRYDSYSVHTYDTGILNYEYPYGSGIPSNLEQNATKGEFTYTASLSYQLPFGLMPYATVAQAAALEYDQASDIHPSLVYSHAWVKDSRLTEAGVKFQLLGGKLVGSADYYWQNRPMQTGGSGAPDVVDTVGTGEELEVRWLATKNLSFTFAGDMQHTEVIGDKSFQYVPASTVCGGVSPGCLQTVFGGAYYVYDFSAIQKGNYAFSVIPHSVVSVYANYITDDHGWGKGGVTWGFTHTSKTSGTVPGAVVYPAYFVSNLSAFYKKGSYEVDLNIDNLFDKLYFTPDADTYVNLGALPSKGREWRLTLKKTF